MRVWRWAIIARYIGLGVVATAASACASPPSQPGVAQSTMAGSPAGSVDGSYRGESQPDQIVQGCGETQREITIKVKGDRAWIHHGHPSLSGSIDPDGMVSMQNSDGTSSLTGSIQGDVLTATETTANAPKKLQGFYSDAQSTCTYVIQATRTSAGGSDDAP